MKKTFVMFAVVLLGCGPSMKPVPLPSSEDFCKKAQENLLQLQCKEDGRLIGGPTRRGTSFETLCLNLIQQGVFTQQDAMCLGQVTNCQQVNSTCMWGQ